MIIESVRSVAVPEEGKPYRKIKVSSDIRSRLPSNVVKDAVSVYIRDKVNHILRGDCVVEVHWNGVDVRTLHLRSIQPLSPEEALLRRNSEAVSTDGEGRTSRISGLRLPLGTPRRPILLPPVATNYPIRPSSTTTLSSAAAGGTPSTAIASSSSLPSLSSSLQSVLSSAYEGSQKKLRVVAINGPLGGKPVIHTPVATSTDGSFQRLGQIISPLRTVAAVPGHGNEDEPGSAVAHTSSPRNIVTTNVSATVARNGVRTVVLNPFSSCPTGNPPRIIARIRNPGPPAMQAPVPAARRRALLSAPAARPSMMFSPQNSQSIRMITPSDLDVRLPWRLPTPVSNILPSRADGEAAGAMDEVVVQPTDVPKQTRILSFPVSKAAQSLATIAPVVTVRQVAASNSNLSVRVNGSVIRAVPGQVIRRVTGEIVRVLDNGLLEPVEVRISPKTIITTRDQPISLDSDSANDSLCDESSTDTDVEVVVGDFKSKKKALRIAASRSRSVKSQPEGIRKVKTPEDEPHVSPKLEAEELKHQIKTELITSDITHSQDDLFDSVLLTPNVQFSEGGPYSQQEIDELFARSQTRPVNKSSSEQATLFSAMVMTEDGELRLDPDLFERYIEHLALGRSFKESEPAAEDISYLFHRKPKSKSQCPVVEPVAKKNLFPNANIARKKTSDTDSDVCHFSSAELEEKEPAEKKIKVEQRRVLPPRTYSRLDAPPKEVNEDCQSEVTVRKKVEKRIRMTHRANNKKAASPAPQKEGLYFFRGVKISEPINCQEAFVVMDRLKTFKNRKTIHLRGVHRKRSVFDLFEASKNDLFFDFYEGCVNPKVKRDFESMRNPLRPINDPKRGKVVSRLVQSGVPTIVSESALVTYDSSEERMSDRGDLLGLKDSENELIDVDSI